MEGRQVRLRHYAQLSDRPLSWLRVPPIRPLLRQDVACCRWWWTVVVGTDDQSPGEPFQHYPTTVVAARINVALSRRRPFFNASFRLGVLLIEVVCFKSNAHTQFRRYRAVARYNTNQQLFLMTGAFFAFWALFIMKISSSTGQR